MTLKTILLAGSVIGTAALAAGPAAAQASQAQIDALNKQIQSLQEQVKTLGDTLNKEIKKVDEKVTKLPTVSVDGGRMRIRSADRANDMAIRARLHFDYGHWFPGDNNTNDYSDGFQVRRAFLGVSGTVMTDWGYEFTANFAGNRGGSSQIQAANITYRGIKDTVLIAGVSQPKFTLDDSTSSNDIPFMERASVNNILVGIGGSDGRTMVGFTTTQASGKLFIAGYLTGELTGSTGNIDDQQNLLGRVAYKAFEDNNGALGIGFSGAYRYQMPTTAGANTARVYRFDDRPEIRIGGDTPRLTRSEEITFVDSVHAYGVDVAGHYRNFWAAAEYATFGASTDIRSQYDDPEFSSWYASAGWIITGERRRYTLGEFAGVRPSWPLGQKGYGAWELAVRYSESDLLDEGARRSGTLATTSLAGEQTVWTLGVNWYVNSAVRVMWNYIIAENDRPGTRPDLETDALAMRVQFQF
ncbi:MAG: hypothetical protein RLY86_238 [Pseudomonadota bacterium]|jgi:phosphate-selective porin OprO/OprP